MPALPIIGMVAGVAGTVSQISSSRKQQKAAQRQADLARRQAAVQNQANANSAQLANTRERVAAQVEANQALANEQMNTVPDAKINTPETPGQRRRAQRAQFRVEGDDEAGALRI